MDDLRKPYDEFERIKNNRHHPAIDPAYPRVTDGTTATQVRLVPRRAIQQIPYGSAKVDGDEGLSTLADYYLQEEIIPHSDSQDSVLGKSWKAVEDTEVYGSTDALVFYKADGDYFGTDFKIPQKREVYPEAYKSSFNECNIFFVKAWYQRSDILAIIKKELQLMSAAKERGEKYKSTWDLEKLKKLIKDNKEGKEKEQKDKTDSEKDRNIKATGFEFIHGYQKGKKAKFFTYCPDHEDDDKFMREWLNPDPRGIMPVHRMYYESDLSNTEGRGVVELVAPLQNFIDSSLQAYQYIRSLMYAPPLLKRGNYSRNQIQLRPDAIIDLGNDPNARLEALSLNTPALSNFSQDYSLFKSQILNIFGSDDQTISSSAGNPSFGKTPAATKARQEIVSVNDNFIRRRYETWIGEVFCTQLNLCFALTQGDREFRPSKEWLEKLSKYTSEYYTVMPNGAVVIHFSEINDKVIDFEVEATTSKAPDSDAAKEKLLEATTTLTETGLIQHVNQQELTKRMLIQLGVEDPEKLIIEPMTQDGAGDPLQALMGMGLSEQQAQMAMQLEAQGYTPAQIEQIIMRQGATR